MRQIEEPHARPPAVSGSGRPVEPRERARAAQPGTEFVFFRSLEQQKRMIAAAAQREDGAIEVIGKNLVPQQRLAVSVQPDRSAVQTAQYDRVRRQRAIDKPADAEEPPL